MPDDSPRLILETKKVRNGPEQSTPDHCGLSGLADGLHARFVPNPLGRPRRNLERPENGRSKGCERPAARRLLWCPQVWDWISNSNIEQAPTSTLLRKHSDKGFKGHPFQREFNHARQFRARRSGRCLNGKAGPYGVDVLREVPRSDVFSQVALGPRPLQSRKCQTKKKLRSRVFITFKRTALMKLALR